MQAYFDNSATTRPCQQAIDAMVDVLNNNWGNPSSTHYIGNDANRILESSRSAVAAALSCTPGEIYFTSGGTESSNLAVFGAAYQGRHKGKRIVSTSVEHPSVDEALNRLEEEGFEVVKLKVNNDGIIDRNELFEAVNSETILVTMMYVNNEVGSIMPVQLIKSAVARAKAPALIHVDAVQAFGKIPVKPLTIGADLVTVSSHKIHGPKGVGALYIRKGVKIKPRTFGGEQELKLRPGTEAMPAIAGFGAAVRELPDANKKLVEVKELRDYMLEKFSEIGGIAVNSPADALPYVTGISIPGIKSEPMLNFLSANGICVSAGSACSKGKKSRVLAEMGLDNDRLESPLRISFSRFTTKEEIDYLAVMIAQGREKIRSTK